MINNTVTIKTTVLGNDVVKIYRNATQFYATFWDSNGYLLKNMEVKFNINGVLYTRMTDYDGKASLNINLQSGTYIITSSYMGSSISNIITIN